MYKRLFFLSFIAAWFLSCTPQPLTWVAIGDSITYLNDHPSETGNRVKKGYMSQVVEQLPHITYVNKGFNGWTSIGVAEKIDDLGLEKADIYTVFLGTNDWWAGCPVGTMADYTDHTGAKTVYGAFRIIIDKLKSLNPDASVILLTPLQRGDFVCIDNYANNAVGSYRAKAGRPLTDVIDAIRNIAAQDGLTVIDLYNESGITLQNMVKFKRLKDPSSGSYKEYPYPDYADIAFDPANDEYPYPVEAVDMTYDGLHPSDKGNAAIARLLVNIFKQIKRPL
ncbi:MAG: SGNH/GDSL hydrolase family protein [Tannerella sp.]|nr:SGNH/GDSL hydrolase family protein [Tannerella sp.]